MVNTRKAVKVVESQRDRVVVVHNISDMASERITLMGVAKPRQLLQKGDKGFIEYLASGSLAGWFWV